MSLKLCNLLILTIIISNVFGSSRWRALTCPKYCQKDVEPVCGSDQVIYKNDCELRKLTCGTNVTRIDMEMCMSSNGSKCNHSCDSTKDFVCGSDGRTYPNKCYLQAVNCQQGISFSHYGSCLNTTAALEICPTYCSERSRDGPICGSDGNVYSSECQMKLSTCGQGVVAVSRSHCKTTRHCDSECWRISRLTCGSDGKLYNNGCQMQRKNCGRFVYDVPVPYCLNKMYRTACPLDCSDKQDKPVCGSDGNIYRNECEMKKMTCGYPLTRYEKIVNVKMEKCEGKKVMCDQMLCPDNEDKVCGNNGVTYLNPCHLRRATCLSSVEQVHVGSCVNLGDKEDRKCPKNCPTNDSKEIICASNGNVYRSECEMEKYTCGQKVVRAPNKTDCEATKYCDAVCEESSPANMICGSDSKFYSSECEMKKQNCGRHMYTVPLSQCLSNFKFNGCGRVCPTSYDPICGTDNKTYSNQCFMEMENCRARSLGLGVVKKYHGKCGHPQQRARHYLYR